MKICVLTYQYPSKHDAYGGVFVKQLVDEWARRGHLVIIAVPYNILYYKKYLKIYETYNVGNGKVVIYRPWYLSFSTFHIGKFCPTVFFRKVALRKIFRRMPAPDVVYGHFWGQAFEGYEYARRNKLPLFVASGESTISFRKTFQTEAFCNFVRGVVCVSSKNQEESVDLGLTTNDKCKVYPNAINNRLFRPLDKTNCRKSLGFREQDFIIVFVGLFNHRKGIKRVSEAIKLNKEKKIFSLFIGRGDEDIDCPNVLFKGCLNHDQIPVYLNAADVFVLPTLHEGCCNAIVEALACGLPVISSDRRFNDDVLNTTNSIRIDPENVEELANAIAKLYDDLDLRKKMGKGALETAKDLTIEKRAEAIEIFMKDRL